MLSHVKRFAGDALIGAMNAGNSALSVLPKKQPAAMQQTPELMQAQASQMDARDARQMEPDGLEDELKRRAFERNAKTAAVLGAGALGYAGLDALMTPGGAVYDDANRA